jgi:hypothetical protein
MFNKGIGVNGRNVNQKTLVMIAAEYAELILPSSLWSHAQGRPHRDVGVPLELAEAHHTGRRGRQRQHRMAQEDRSLSFRFVSFRLFYFFFPIVSSFSCLTLQALHLAAIHQRDACALLLVRKGTNVKITNKDGKRWCDMTLSQPFLAKVNGMDDFNLLGFDDCRALFFSFLFVCCFCVSSSHG